MEFIPGLARWLHIVAGITWIGLLYYFNLVQIPAGSTGRMVKAKPIKVETAPKVERTVEKRERTRTKKFKST